MLKIQSSYQKCLSVDQMGIFTQQIRIKMEKEVFLMEMTENSQRLYIKKEMK